MSKDSAADADELLSAIPDWIEQKDVNALAEHSTHPDKRVRKAVRKAIHTLRSKGISVPEKRPRGWSMAASAPLRGQLEPLAFVDTRSIPGALRFLLSIPDEDGALLFAGAIDPNDRILDFAAYRQTDGQRARMQRDWNRETEGRVVPVEWLQQRIRWARENTMRAGFSVPRALDSHLERLPADARSRPEPFVRAQLEHEQTQPDSEPDAVLAAIGAHQWPVMLDLQNVLGTLAAEQEDLSQADEETRTQRLIAAAAGDAVVRDGLSGPIANALEDAATGAWLHGQDVAKAALNMADALREADEPEQLPWAARLLAYQVASYARVQMSQAGAGQMHDHDHHHDHDHDH